jgi:2-polyprenyl-3-methyl-5-hydroxy-6-metoxy-1,4-benzoquinol methylase
MHAESRHLSDKASLRQGHGLSETDLVRFCADIFTNEPMYERFVNEARFGLSRVLPTLSSFDSENVNVLEVGAGTCILSSYLASKGLHVTALEPLGPEFDFYTVLQSRVLDFCRRRSIALNLVRMTGEQLASPGQFDVAFTINALEHMHDPLLTIDKMCNSLKPRGVVLIHCPNYTIPFDSHFNIFLVTRSKRVNEWLYRSRIERYPQVWDELTFIRYVDVRRRLVHRGFDFTFNQGVMRDLVARLFNDRIFAQRMPLPVRAIGAGLKYCGLLNALRLIPLRFQTPMEVQIRKP